MFQFRAFPSYGYWIHRTILRYCLSVFPHSEISGSSLICSSPKLFAACHVLHRLLMPRHSPCALISLTISGSQKELCGSQKKLSFNCSCYPISTILFACSSRCNPLLPCFSSHHFSLFSFQGADIECTCVPSKLNKVSIRKG